MKILLICSPEDEDFLASFQRLPSLVGHQVAKTTQKVVNTTTLDRLLELKGIDAVICSQQDSFEEILKSQPDYLPPIGRKELSLDDYAGSLLKLKSGKEVLIINRLERLRTVPYEKMVLDIYLSKLTKPETWWQQTAFKWGMVTLENKDKILAKLQAADLIAIDIENPYPQVERRIISCVSYTLYDKATHTTESWVVPFEELWHWEFIRQANRTEAKKVFQNGLHDNAYFLRWGCPVRNWVLDTFHLFHSWLSELPKRLDFVTSFTLRVVRYWKDDGKTGNFNDLCRYCAMDGWATINALLSLMQRMPDWAVANYVEHEFPMIFPSLHASMEGLECDVERMETLRLEKKVKLEKLLYRIQYLLSAPGYNPNSAPQNMNLFKLLGCGGLGGTGKIPTLRAKAAHPLNNFFLTLVESYKQEAKQVSTYLNPEKLWHGRIYYSLNPGGTDTLRAASKESSFDCGWQIQNIPRDDPSFKQCVLAPPGWYLAEVDKKQSEARCVAYLSGDANLIQLVESPHDYHSWNAAKFFGIPYEKIYSEELEKTLDKALRDLSKRTNHGANYNMGPDVMLDTMGPKRVAEAKITLKLPHFYTLRRVCQYLLDRYSATYPDVKGRWYESIIQQIETTKKLVSAFGWVRVFHGSPRNIKTHLNSAVAHAPQNLSVMIINKEWYKIWRETVYGELRGLVRIKAQIHDSLLFIYRNMAAALRVQELMDLRVPVTGSDGVTRTLFIPSDLSTGKEPTRRWSDLK